MLSKQIRFSWSTRFVWNCPHMRLFSLSLYFIISTYTCDGDDDADINTESHVYHVGGLTVNKVSSIIMLMQAKMKRYIATVMDLIYHAPVLVVFLRARTNTALSWGALYVQWPYDGEIERSMAPHRLFIVIIAKS